MVLINVKLAFSISIDSCCAQLNIIQIILFCRDRTKAFSLNRRFTRLFGQNVG